MGRIKIHANPQARALVEEPADKNRTHTRQLAITRKGLMILDPTKRQEPIQQKYALYTLHQIFAN